MASTIERRVPPGGGIAIGIILGLLLWAAFFTLASAQEPAPKQTWYVFVDTAGVARVGPPGIYITWVFAKATPKAYPSSGILVAWDCNARPRMVKRLAQVVYKMNKDSTGVFGSPIEVDRPWQPVTDERMANLVCEIGATRGPAMVEPTKPQSPYSDA
jgi:hypothetical protein